MKERTIPILSFGAGIVFLILIGILFDVRVLPCNNNKEIETHESLMYTTEACEMGCVWSQGYEYNSSPLNVNERGESQFLTRLKSCVSLRHFYDTGS